MGDEQDAEQEHRVGLAEMIETLRRELETAQIQGAARPVAFGVEKVDLELKVAVSRKLKTGGGIKFWVLSAEGGAEGGSETVHNFKLTLSPLDPVTKARLEVAGDTETAINRNK